MQNEKEIIKICILDIVFDYNNTWCWTNAVNWELERLTFTWPGFLLLVLQGTPNLYQSMFLQVEQEEACKCSWSLYH